IPAAAGMIVSVVHGFGRPIFNWWLAVTWLLLVGLIGFLMVSTWRFWSGKEINLSRRHPVRWIVLFALVIWLLVFFSRVVLLGTAFIYMFSGIVARAAYGRQRRKASQSDALNASPSTTPQ